MTLTRTNRGAGSRNTGAENSIAVVPTSNFTANALAVLAIAYDNSAAGGADPWSAIIDSKGNTWTQRINVLNDPGVSNDGLALRIFTTPQNAGALTTTDSITVSFGGITTVARAWALNEVTGSVGVPTYSTGGTGTGSDAAPTITTASITSGNLVIGFMGAEHNSAITGDSDTTNGTWSAQQTSGVGTTTAGMEISSQGKVTTGTGTQSYDLTITSADWAVAWIEVTEAAYTQTYTPFGGIIRELNPADWAGTVTAVLEVHGKTSNATHPLLARLYNITTAAVVTGSDDISIASTSKTRDRSSSFSLAAGDNEYRVEFGGDATFAFTLYDAVLRIEVT